MGASRASGTSKKSGNSARSGRSARSSDSVTRARERLEARLRKLLARLGAIESDLRRPENRDLEERALEAENDQVLEGLDKAERDEVARIRAALARIDAGTFGICERCGGSIAEKRLEAVPDARFCVRCAD